MGDGIVHSVFPLWKSKPRIAPSAPIALRATRWGNYLGTVAPVVVAVIVSLRLGDEMDELLKLLGFGTPFIYAATTYGLFHWLDANASDEGKAAISHLLKSSIGCIQARFGASGRFSDQASLHS
jgi:hypothetical protein